MPLQTIPLLVVVTMLFAGVMHGTSAVADDISSYGAVRISDNNIQSLPETSFYGNQESMDTNMVFTGGGHYGNYSSPASQFAPPQNYPANRRFFYYRRSYPDRWYGQTGSRRPAYAPMVYHPTDTTQLGYYYQHVPVWQPNPRMIPEPHPATWHHWGRLPAEMVWHRTGQGEPKGIVNPPGGSFNYQPPPQSFSTPSTPIEQFQPEESIKQKQPLPLQPKKLVPPAPESARSLLNEVR